MRKAAIICRGLQLFLNRTQQPARVIVMNSSSLRFLMRDRSICSVSSYTNTSENYRLLLIHGLSCFLSCFWLFAPFICCLSARWQLLKRKSNGCGRRVSIPGLLNTEPFLLQKRLDNFQSLVLFGNNLTLCNDNLGAREGIRSRALQLTHNPS